MSDHSSARETGSADAYLIERIRAGDAQAWQALIDRYEGRLLAYADSRLRSRATSEDVVQEVFIGFLTSLPNYDPSRPLEGYLFSICAYKLTDHLRREGRRPSIQMHPRSSVSGGSGEIVGTERVASSIARSGERQRMEAAAIEKVIREQIENWKHQQQWTKLRVIESLIVRGMSNKQVAEQQGLSQQQVANFKSDFQNRLKAVIRRQTLDAGVFPELAE